MDVAVALANVRGLILNIRKLFMFVDEFKGLKLPEDPPLEFLSDDSLCLKPIRSKGIDHDIGGSL